MKIEYKIVEAIRDILKAAEEGFDPDEPGYQDYIDGVQAAYSVASKIADGF